MLAPPGAAPERVSRLEGTAASSAPEEFVSVIDLTHGRALVRLTDGQAADLLASLCGVDDRGGPRSYLLHCERSSGQYSPQAAAQLATCERAGFGHLPVCIAKTHLSISSDPALKGAPTGWTLPVREVRASVGAGFIYPICGDMRTMPGLNATPAATRIDLDPDGLIIGLSLSRVA